jgi:hypothetical protein
MRFLLSVDRAAKEVLVVAAMTRAELKSAPEPGLAN